MAAEQALIEVKRARAAPQGDERQGRDLPERKGAAAVQREGRAAHGDLAERGQHRRLQRSGQGSGRHCNDGKLGKAAAQGVDGLRRGLVRNAQADGGIFAVKTAEHLQQHGMQGRLAAGDGDHAAAQFALALQLGLARAQLLHGGRDVGIESLALRRQLHAAAGAQEQAAAELRLEIVHGARQVRLAVDQRLRRAGKAAVPRYGFKDAVIIQRDVHVILLYKIDMETISTIDYPYKNRAIIIHPWNGIKEESL